MDPKFRYTRILFFYDHHGAWQCGSHRPTSRRLRQPLNKNYGASGSPAM
jgi:hypothetical protein